MSGSEGYEARMVYPLLFHHKLWLGSLVIGLPKVENLVHELRKHEPQTIRSGVWHLIGSHANFLEVWLFMAQHPRRNPRNPRIAADKYQTIWLR